MNMLLPWVVFPGLLLLVAVGCGLLVESVAGFRLPGTLVPPVGVALVIVAAGFATMSSVTAQLAAPLVVALAVIGYGVSGRWRGRRVDGWAAACAVAVFAVYAAPIVLSGSPTFAGYISLDDTATWLGLTDHVMEHGRAVAGLAPSTYQQVLTDYLDGGVPLGAFMVLGVGGKLTGQDLAWVFQPTMAIFATMLALTIYAACARLVSSRPLRALAAFLGAQPALLFAYALWGGIKELAAAAALALVCALIPTTIARWRAARGVLPVSLATAALLAVLSPAGGVWLLIPIAIAAFVLARGGLRRAFGAATRVIAGVAIFSIPSIAIGYAFVHGAVSSEITSSTEVANLGHPLDKLQLFGVWPATDFRTSPHDRSLTYILIGVLVASCAAGLLFAWRRRDLGVPFYLVTGAGGVVLLFILQRVGLSSPWLNAKAMAEASPAIVAAAIAGAAAVFETGRRTEAVVACAAVAVGVLWSNGLAYSNAWLAPRSQLAELQTIGQRLAGDGPTLMTEYQPYGVRHFLRRLDPEAASERRRRVIPLRSGGGLETGLSADLDEFDLNAILVYRTIVLRHSPVESRPPFVYRPVWNGRWYEAWQRPVGPRSVLEHLPLGDALDPAAVPNCADVLRLAQEAQAVGGSLATVDRRTAPLVLDLTRGSYPPRWNEPTDEPGTLVTHGSGTLSLTTSVRQAGRYTLWLGDSFRRTVTASVDGNDVGRVTDQLNNSGQWTLLGSATLGRGSHRVVLRYGGSRLSPGSGGFPFAMGPLIVAPAVSDLPVRLVSPADARSLCGRRLDWVEALGP